MTAHPSSTRRAPRSKYTGTELADVFDVSRQCVSNWKRQGCPHSLNRENGRPEYDPAQVHRWLLLVAIGHRQRTHNDPWVARAQQSRTLARLIFLQREEALLERNAARAAARAA